MSAALSLGAPSIEVGADRVCAVPESQFVDVVDPALQLVAANKAATTARGEVRAAINLVDHPSATPADIATIRSSVSTALVAVRSAELNSPRHVEAALRRDAAVAEAHLPGGSTLRALGQIATALVRLPGCRHEPAADVKHRPVSTRNLVATIGFVLSQRFGGRNVDNETPGHLDKLEKTRNHANALTNHGRPLRVT